MMELFVTIAKCFNVFAFAIISCLWLLTWWMVFNRHCKLSARIRALEFWVITNQKKEDFPLVLDDGEIK